MVFNNKSERELDELYAAKNYDGIIEKVNFLYNEKNVPIKVEKQLALAYYYKADYSNSLKHFENIVAQEKNTENLFNVMMSLLALKNIDRAQNVFDEIIKTHKGAKSTGKGKNFLPQLCVPFIRYYFACGLADANAYDKALVQLEELKKVYISAKITDDTYLYLRGIPFLGNTLELAKRVFDGIDKDFKNSDFLNELAAAIDTDGKKFIKKHYST